MKLTIGSENTNLIPEADRVKMRLLDIQPNKFQPNDRLDFTFQFMDPDYDDDNADDDTIAEIRRLSEDTANHYETANLPKGALGKRLKLYQLIKGMNGGKDIEEGEDIDLDEFKGKDYMVDFEHVEKKGGPPDYAVVPGVYKAQIAKLRPAKKVRQPKLIGEVPVTPVRLEPDEDDDLGMTD